MASSSASGPLINLLVRCNHDLDAVHHKLEEEFRSLYPDHANPLKLVSRIKKIQDDLSIVKDQCQELLSAKQDLIDKARTTLVGNRNLLHRIQASVAIPTSDAEDPSYDNFKESEFTGLKAVNQMELLVFAPSASKQPTSTQWRNAMVIDEWTAQVQSRAGKEAEEDINKLLFSAKVGG